MSIFGGVVAQFCYEYPPSQRPRARAVKPRACDDTRAAVNSPVGSAGERTARHTAPPTRTVNGTATGTVGDIYARPTTLGRMSLSAGVLISYLLLATSTAVVNQNSRNRAVYCESAANRVQSPSYSARPHGHPRR